MSDTTDLYTRTATIGIVATIALFGVVLYLKAQGIKLIGPIPTLALPLAAFTVRAWLLVKFAPEKIQDRQRTVAFMVTAACAIAVVFAGMRV